MKSSALTLFFLAGLALIVVAGCKSVDGVSGTATNTPAQAVSQNPDTATPQPASPTGQAAAPASPTAQAAAPASPSACASDTCVEDGDFLLDRPIGTDGRNTIETSFRFGAYSSSTRDVHHGVDFLNSSGTPVLAAADGKVVVAGDDSSTAYALHKNVYGNLVILQHKLPGISQPVFTLYSQLSQVEVKVGDQVKAGQEIGLVGMSGSVTGSTLHFEVRLGENTFQATRNPELWLKPLKDEKGQLEGALAGRVVDAQGNYVPLSNILIERLGGADKPVISRLYLKTYAEKRLVGLDPWDENFAAGDLPAGSYKISFSLNGVQQRVVDIQPGKLTLVTFEIK